ncbi:MAG: response regulator, partial [Desulfuromonadales bacterium]|nr:response regulator [Desulfuromonadales bacterium]
MTADAENRPKVLIVDDEPFFRQVMADTLSAGGYDSIETPSGNDVPRLLGQHKIGAVLTDLEMPEVSGIEVLQLVNDLQPDVPVLVISGHQDFFAVREVLSGGALDYLVKPFADAELLAAVERAFAAYQANLEAKKNREEAERLLADLVLLREVGETASGEANLQSLLERVIALIVESVDVEVASLMLPAKDGSLRIRAAHGLPDGVRENAVINPGEGVSGHVYASGEPVLLNDIVEDGRFSPVGDKGQYSTASALSLPLKGRDRTIGVLNVNNKSDGTPFSAHDQHLFASIAHQATLAIENFSLVNELRNKAKELEALNNARSRLVCNLSHELKTPLTSVLGFADLLNAHRSEISEAELDEYLVKIADSSLQMEKLISGMLLLFSIDSGTARW